MSTNDPGDNTAGAIFIALLLTHIVSAIMPEAIHSESLESAVEKCELNGGIDFVEFNYATKHTATCNNGAMFDLPSHNVDDIREQIGAN